MLRTIGAAVAGYLSMMLAMFIIFMLSYHLLGEERAFRPGLYDVSMTWAILSMVVTVAASMAAGYIASLISRNMSGPRVLAGLVLLIGIGAAAYMATVELPDMARTGSVDGFGAMQNARNPLWLMFVNPILSVVGVLLGARLRKQGGGESIVSRA